jgi:hypothetical protein
MKSREGLARQKKTVELIPHLRAALILRSDQEIDARKGHDETAEDIE